MARHDAAACRDPERRDFAPASVVRERAARMKSASRRRIERIGNLARDRRARFPRHRKVGNRSQQHARIRMLRRCEQTLRRRELGDAPEIHHTDAVRDVMDNGEVVRYEKIRQAHAPLEIAHQIQYLRLHRDVERRRRFEMIWRKPGFPALLVTYGVSSDLFFSGHTAIAVYGAAYLGATLGPLGIALGLTIAAFEMAAVLVLRAHYTMDVFAGAVTALLVHRLAAEWSPTVDHWIAAALVAIHM